MPPLGKFKELDRVATELQRERKLRDDAISTSLRHYREKERPDTSCCVVLSSHCGGCVFTFVSMHACFMYRCMYLRIYVFMYLRICVST